MNNIDLILKHIFERDVNVLTAFVHGSFLDDSFTNRNYLDLRIYEHDAFQCSLLYLKNIDHDVDVVCVSQEPHITERTIRKRLDGRIKGFFLTVNIVSRRVFEDQVVSTSPTAIKRIVALKECNVFVGNEYFSCQQARALACIQQIDREFQIEFANRKQYLRSLIANGNQIHLLSALDYSRMFPLFFEFICGQLEAGFPEGRLKIVLPGEMNLKFRLDIELGRLVALS